MPKPDFVENERVKVRYKHRWYKGVVREKGTKDNRITYKVALDQIQMPVEHTDSQGNVSYGKAWMLNTSQGTVEVYDSFVYKDAEMS